MHWLWASFWQAFLGTDEAALYWFRQKLLNWETKAECTVESSIKQMKKFHELTYRVWMWVFSLLGMSKKGRSISHGRIERWNPFIPRRDSHVLKGIQAARSRTGDAQAIILSWAPLLFFGAPSPGGGAEQLRVTACKWCMKHFASWRTKTHVLSFARLTQNIQMKH